MGRNGGKNSRKRKRPRHKLSWKRWLIYGPIIALVLAASVGNYIIDFHEHPTLRNGILLVVVIAFGTVGVLWLAENSRQ